MRKPIREERKMQEIVGVRVSNLILLGFLPHMMSRLFTYSMNKPPVTPTDSLYHINVRTSIRTVQTKSNQ
jgi:hypothetical protein